MNEFEPNVFEVVIDCMYTFSAKITEENGTGQIKYTKINSIVHIFKSIDNNLNKL